MSIELSVTAKGQITLKRAVLDHLGVRPGQKVDVALLPDGRVELNAAPARRDLSRVFGMLRRAGQRTVSVEEMQAAIEAGAASE
jgi:hypothetical protein